MRCLDRNKTVFYYALYKGRSEITTIDDDGNTLLTGEYASSYGKPIKCSGNVSPASGTTINEMFGTSESYDKIIVLAGTSTPIDESSVLWIGVATSAPYNYVVKRVAKSLNSTAIAVRKVSVNA